MTPRRRAIKKNDGEERYTLTPKGLALIALQECGLIQSMEDPRVDGFWKLFEAYMREHGYVKDE